MGEGKKQALRVEFDRELELEFHGAKITGDAGWLRHRELDEARDLLRLAGRQHRLKFIDSFTPGMGNEADWRGQL